jgi:hypothetical protein
MLPKETKQSLIMNLLELDSGKEHEKDTESEFWQLGKDYVIRTVTMIYLGTLKAINKNELLLEDCAWIPATSRWSEFLNGKKPNEMEPYRNDVIIGRGALLDATIMNQKIKRETI